MNEPKPTDIFQEFPKIARFSRDIIVSEKIDGTNACVFIDEDGQMRFGSRTRWITPEDDNYGFAKWATANATELAKLGPGRHFGEWWGGGIQRGYGFKNEKFFSLFNSMRWCKAGETPKQIQTQDPRVFKTQEVIPACCSIVPVLYHGPFDTNAVELCLIELSTNGSQVAPGYMKPEGVVIFHTAGNVGFKKTLEKDIAKGA